MAEKLMDYMSDLGYDDLTGIQKNNYGDAYMEQASSMYNLALANQYNLQNWERQNEYNSPSEVMKRFSAAGLNPNLIAGQVSGSNAGSIAAVSAPKGADFAGSRVANFQRIANTINLVQQVAGAVADTFKSIQAIKASKLGNDLAGYRLDAVRNHYYGGDFENIPMAYAFMNPSGMSSYAKYREYSQLIDEKVRGLGLTNDQRQYYNEHIAPLLRSYYSKRNDTLDQQYNLRQYNLEFMQTLTPGERTIWNMLNQFLGTAGRFF